MKMERWLGRQGDPGWRVTSSEGIVTLHLGGELTISYIDTFARLFETTQRMLSVTY